MKSSLIKNVLKYSMIIKIIHVNKQIYLKDKVVEKYSKLMRNVNTDIIMVTPINKEILQKRQKFYKLKNYNIIIYKKATN